MNIALFGASGAIGSILMKQFLDGGDTVYAYVRNPGKITLTNENLHIVKSELIDTGAMETVIADVDIVVSTLGPDAIKELIEQNFLFIAVFSKGNDFFPQLQILRQIRPTSIFIFLPDHDIPNRTMDFFNGINDGMDSYFETEPERGVFLNKNKVFFWIHYGVIRP